MRGNYRQASGCLNMIFQFASVTKRRSPIRRVNRWFPDQIFESTQSRTFENDFGAMGIE
jgi:hypothetical protein